MKNPPATDEERERKDECNQSNSHRVSTEENNESTQNKQSLAELYSRYQL